MENISNRERLVWACMLSSSRIGANDSCVYATSVIVRQLLGQTTSTYRRGVETKLSIKLVHGGRVTLRVPRVNFEGTRRRQRTDSIWNTSFSNGGRFLKWRT